MTRDLPSPDLPTPDRPLKIGTRGSPLALVQAHETRDRLGAAFGLPGAAFQIVVIKVTGDMVQDRALSAIGGKGLFTREIEEALAEGAIDIAVHSMKDMPVDQPEGLLIDCYLPREDVRDAFVSPVAAGLMDLPQGALVGSSSLRRRAQVLVRRPDLQLVEFRGNVQTRMRKLGEGVAAATFLAMAGLNRLGLSVAQVPVEPEEMLPAVAQGAIGVERRAADVRVGGMLAAIHDRDTGLRLAAERAFLRRLDGSCQTPIAGLAVLDGGLDGVLDGGLDGGLWLRGEILRPDGGRVVTGELRGAVGDGAMMGAALADELLGRAGPGFFS